MQRTHPPIVFCALVCINQGHLVYFFSIDLILKCLRFPLSFLYFSGSFFTSYLNHGEVVEPYNISMAKCVFFPLFLAYIRQHLTTPTHHVNNINIWPSNPTHLFADVINVWSLFKKLYFAT